MFGAVVVVAILGVLWLVASWSADQEAIQGTEDLASVQLPSDEVDGDTNAGLALAETTTTRPTSTSTSASASASASASTTPESGSASTLVLFTGRDAIYGRYVAVLWSGFVSANSSQDADQSPETQLASFQSRFGSDVIAVDSDQFGSLRDGTAAVVYDGGFSSARNAKQWCRDNGFPGTQDCFGVVLSDDYTPDQRGDLIRIYDL